MAARTKEVQSVVDQVRHWSKAQRAELAEGILETLRDEPVRGHGNLENLLGLLPSDGPPLTDAEIDRMLEDELIRKYGA